MRLVLIVSSFLAAAVRPASMSVTVRGARARAERMPSDASGCSRAGGGRLRGLKEFCITMQSSGGRTQDLFVRQLLSAL